MLVSAFRDEDPNGPSAGAAYLFVGTDGAWVQEQKLLPQDGASEDKFGSLCVALAGDTAIVGAPGVEDDDGNQSAGAAYVFEHRR